MNVVPMATPMKMQTKRAWPAASASPRRAKAASGASALRIATADVYCSNATMNTTTTTVMAASTNGASLST